MLRRLATPAFAALAATCSSSVVSSSRVVLQSTRRCNAVDAEETAAATHTGNNNNNNNNRRGGGYMARNNNNNNRARTTRTPLPPAFDVVHWNDDNMAAGHLLRVVHRDSFLVLDYHQQRHRSTDNDAGPRSERIVTVTLPPVYIARLLGVLEGRIERVDVQSRFTNAVFAPDVAKGKHHYTLKCASMRPTTGQQQSIDGNDLNEETIEWEVSFDAAESLMLQRFLSEALRYNSGFARRSAAA